MRSLVWFRSDLRVADNPALHHASLESEDGIVAAFLTSPRQWADHDWGRRKVGYLIASLESLGQNLANLGIPLVVAEAPWFKDAPDVLHQLIERHGCDALYFNREYEFNEASRDQQVTELLRPRGIEVRGFNDQTIFAPGSVTTRQGEPYSVFTPFSKNWLHQLDEEVPLPLPTPVALGDPVSKGLKLPASLRSLGEEYIAESDSPASEAAAELRLTKFLEEAADRYARNRNHPATNATSGLSAALSIGVISPKTSLARAIEVNGGRLSGGSEGIEAWIRQLAWRDFYRHVLSSFPRVSRGRSFLEWTERVEWRDSSADFNAWQIGQTGVPLVDAGMRQLRETGWLHNRVRMVTAMYLAKDLLLDWRLGEAHFMRELIDGDFANNNGGWQWSASTGVDAAPYFRIMNPWTQAKRFDPKGEYIQTWVPELGEVPPTSLHDPKKLTALVHAGLDYAEPLVDHRAARIRAVSAFEQAKQLRTP
jgi:deoxyribodipyrimidine photo-lyase